MKKKFYINSNLERLFSFAATLVLILMVNIVLTQTLLKKIQANAEASFIQRCDDTVDDYALAVDAKLKQLESRIDIFYAKLAYKTLSIETIKKFLQDEKKQVAYPFNMVVYSDKNGISWNSEGEEFDIKDRLYFQKIMSGESTFYVTNVLESKHDGESCLIFARPVYNEEKEITGVLFATCPIERAAEYFAEIAGNNRNKRFAIRDSNKRLILHYNSKWLNWVYSPWKYDDKILVTDDEEFKVKESISTEGDLVYVFYRYSEISPWTISYAVPVEDFVQLKKSQSAYQNFVLEVIIISLSLIFLLEIWFHSILEKHQILSTHIDSITHLMVRSHFEKEANKMLRKHPRSKFMMLEADIRGFKFINQQHGENVGNQVLLQFSKLLYEVSKNYEGILSRGYADHFYIFFKISSVLKAMHFFKNNFNKQVDQIKSLEIPFTPKFGISFFIPKKMPASTTAQVLITRANFAKDTIKENALQDFAIYDEKLLKRSSENNFIETHMESALKNNEFFVMYQPKVDLKTDKVVGAEALVRWQSPELGYMPPNSFIPLFEKNNFVVKLDFYVYEEVFKFLRKSLDKGEPAVPISVNMSRNHDKPERFVHDFIVLLKKYQIPPDLVEVELLERSSMDKNILREITIMLQKEGFRVAMDDFGSGESSLNMLSTIPVNILKFDRSFLFANDASTGKLDETSEAFIETLVDLGKNLKKETIFEGVETEEQRDFLRKIKCDQVQGFFYSKPLREEEYMEFLKNHR